jgi:uncharacterized radical SAM superfamily protein
MKNLEAALEAARSGRPLIREDAEAILSLERIPRGLLEAGGEARDHSLGKKLRFYYPLPRFHNVSVTGTRCALNCAHCSGHYLVGMTGAETPSRLKKLCTKLDAEGAIGILVSGGSNSHGRVPLDGFYDTLKWVKENTDLLINVHTGLMDAETAEKISSTGIDIASVDVVGSDDTIRRVYGLNATVENYWNTLKALVEAGVPHVVPHICVGLDFGEIRGEAVALDMAQKLDSELIVILGLIPTAGTAMEAVEPPSSEDIAKVVAAARLMCPKSDIALGCMRPRKDKAKMERLAVNAGVNRIVLPSKSTFDLVKTKFSVKQLDGCCSIPKEFESRAQRRRNL